MAARDFSWRPDLPILGRMSARDRLEEQGWASDAHGLAEPAMTSLLARKDAVLAEAILQVERARGVSLGAFDDAKLDDIELAKAATRAVLRYDRGSLELAKAVAARMRGEFGLHDEMAWCTLPYPIVHFPMDASEKGPMHRDAYPYIRDFHTTWTPLNDCLDEPLAVIEGSHRRPGFLAKLLGRRADPGPTVHPDPRIGQFLVWYGSTQHEGLLNRSGRVTMALVVRFTNTPIRVEGTRATEALERDPLDVPPTDVPATVAALVAAFEALQARARLDAAGATKASLAEDEATIAALGLSSLDRKRLSFLLSLWAQRLEVKRDVSHVHRLASVCARDNLHSLRKASDALLARAEAGGVAFLQDYLDAYPSVQAEHVVRMAADALPRTKPPTLRWPGSPPLLEWSIVA